MSVHNVKRPIMTGQNLVKTRHCSVKVSDILHVTMLLQRMSGGLKIGWGGNVPDLVEIGSTDMPKSRGGVCPPAPTCSGIPAVPQLSMECYWQRTTDTQWRHKSKKSEKLGRVEDKICFIHTGGRHLVDIIDDFSWTKRVTSREHIWWHLVDKSVLVLDDFS
jgi:hypothetical protein